MFNRNTIKISYSCMLNTKRIINNHNRRLLQTSTDNSPSPTVTKKCISRQLETCPLNGNCLQSSIIYQATVTRRDNLASETYIGLTENNFKTRYRNHTASFRHSHLRNSTELSKHIWTLKDSKVNYSLSWRILSKAQAYDSTSKRSNLCLKEKLSIIHHPELSSLNKRNELVSSCRHRHKALLRHNQHLHIQTPNNR